MTILKLMKNMHLKYSMSSDSERQLITKFAEWILRIGDGNRNSENVDS